MIFIVDLYSLLRLY